MAIPLQRLEAAFANAFRDGTDKKGNFRNKRDFINHWKDREETELRDALRKDTTTYGVYEEWRAANGGGASEPYPNLPKDFDRAGLTDDQLKLIDSLVGTLNPADTGIDVSALTDQELSGYIKDAKLAVDPYFDEQKRQLDEDYRIQKEKTTREYDRVLEDLGIQSSSLRSEVSKQLTRVAEDRAVAQGQLDRGFVDRIRSTQDALEEQGLTFSGKAVEEIGNKSAYAGVTQEGEAQKDLRLASEDLNQRANRQTTDLNEQLTRGLSDIDRALERARTDKSGGLNILSTQYGREAASLKANRAFETRSAAQDIINQNLTLGRQLPKNYNLSRYL